jgi:hypothetical protein
MEPLRVLNYPRLWQAARRHDRPRKLGMHAAFAIWEAHEVAEIKRGPPEEAE